MTGPAGSHNELQTVCRVTNHYSNEENNEKTIDHFNCFAVSRVSGA